MTDEKKTNEATAEETQRTPTTVPNRVADDQRKTVRRVLRALFNESDGGQNVKALRDALFINSPVQAKEEANAILASLNAVDGTPTDARFNDKQRDGLKALLSELKYAPISPIGPYAQPDFRNRISQDALHFWRELLSKEPGEVEDFHLRISDYAADPGNPTRLQRVLETMRAYAPEGTWGQKHANALAAVNTRSSEFRGLAWYHFVSDIW
ncbi:hypothetical protein D7Y15_05615 [Corallococcus sp. AB030]|uniref:hypothetical protein n=1 Tax=Corallococcus TaxID=83461 RepID=UPI000EA2F426|nr:MULTISPECIES: hypothetical protein [unclassified Corallococcus]RKH31210.1 hypothetical protein D7V77_00630 [Corallococcus sp. CA041A]RKI19098.1 hypothetical protein D7Y15_05615 [Corallococcus sp. AB030]